MLFHITKLKNTDMKDILRKNIISLLLYVIVLLVYVSTNGDGNAIMFICGGWLVGHLKDLY